MNAVTLTKPNTMLFCFVKLSLNGYWKTYLIKKLHLTAVIQNYPYAKSRSLKFYSQRLMGAGWGEDICGYAAI